LSGREDGEGEGVAIPKKSARKQVKGKGGANLAGKRSLSKGSSSGGDGKG